MSKKSDKGYLLPETIDPPQVSLCICIPCDPNHALAFLGQLNELTFWSNWQRDVEHTGKDAARVWLEIYDNAREQLDKCGVFDVANPCGCNNEGRQFRINEDGEYEYSDDGGVTWEDASQLDPRNNSTIFQPLDLEAGEVTRCAASENIVSQMQDQLSAFVNDLNAVGSLASIAAVIVGLVAIFLSGGALLPLVATFAALMINAGPTAIAAAFTSEVWDDLTCAIYCSIGDDGLITSSDIGEILSKAGETITGLAYSIIEHWINLYGPVGMTNMGRTGTSTGSGCGDCDCPECLEGCTNAGVNLTGQLNTMPRGWTLDFASNNASTAFLRVGDNFINFNNYECLVDFSYTIDVAAGRTVNMYVNDVLVKTHVGPVGGSASFTMDENTPTNKIKLVFVGAGPDGSINIQPFQVTICE